ncbi:hypothetical protein LTR10_012626 [Elasticomyces elasticus]|uniref:AB hydrolase-1 domain-containing protein n=1 Tax=Exophiala sideris TaxID=1016849 RepID=A0ABR0JTB6_9EURO|nr:hypothetical protein LTR10_012626 [Elasticomyces elasticus]KAK5040173.1 hypothetical protein LTS07_000670 [Exophiala sideris]KAK5043400.1 hypothetical protein LTR13_001171 [Exophiala sideris]KAK5068551.1 hypothetical protein LTR69_000671 [Exophiala sideris]KAK5186149.1 hypothetical protein LTR44_001204 [Eurotiomycetes sp. CCFEE 6388]
MDPPIYDMTEDVESVKKAITEVVEDGRDVVLVMHSYGGMPGAQAVKGLGKKERADKGLPGGVVRLVFLAAFVFPEGFQVSPRGQTKNFIGIMKADLEKGVLVFDPALRPELWWHDLSREEAAKWDATVKPCSLGPFWTTTTYAGWRYIPSTFMLTSRDKVFPAEVAQQQIDFAKAQNLTGLENVEKIDSGHFPMLSQPQEVADLLRKAAGL